MQTITTVGLDIAKSVFQMHGVDAEGQVVMRRQLKRRYVLAFFQKLPSCLVGIEACASSHHWSRELMALGHTVRLMPPAYVKPYVKRQKNDATDAEAICEAVTRANMRFVATKTPEQQSGLVLHRTRQQTAVINAIRAHLAEFGIVAPVGRNGVEDLLDVVADPSDKRVPEIARACLAALGAQLHRLKEQILEFDRMIRAWHRSSEMSLRLDDCPGVGPVLATAALLLRNQPEAALELIDRGLSIVSHNSERFFEAELYRLKARALLMRGAPDDEAGSLLEQALRTARGQQARSLELRAATDLARLWINQGKRAEAREVLVSIYTRFSEGFDTRDLKEAKTVLDALAQ